MSKSLYCYEKGDCRGFDFGDKVILDAEKTIATIERAIELKATDEDEYEDFVDRLCCTSSMTYYLINGSDVCDDKVTAKDRVQMIKDGKSFNIVLEESEIGFGPSKKEAKLAYVEVSENGEEW